ncbi:Hypothetical protein SRAE_2000257400 [Strongyloides ratti]|uniref:Uncharacterized protein n=1 Tax=Strongyloides ratti TaxID=34506 RepID=A0A090LIE1_STRRB|nr:Hypothetical protein SRAE_2000257400 [Strongyloides ratti]CEF67913.1 Hypothetical protein SRAE_2000257400 [Strongyloides ratti]
MSTSINNNNLLSSKKGVNFSPEYEKDSTIKSTSITKIPPGNSQKSSSSIPFSQPVKRHPMPCSNISTNLDTTSLVSSNAGKRLNEAFTFWKMNNLANFKISSQEFTILEKELEKQNIEGTKCKDVHKWLINNNGNYEKQVKKFSICIYILSKYIYISKQTALDTLYESARQGVLTFSELKNSYYIDFIKKMEPDVSLTLEQLALIIKKILKKRFH